jgi:hypothetical protein
MNKVLSFVFSIILLPVFSQVGPRAWQDHLGINSCNSVTKRGSVVYASYRNGLIKFDQADIVPQTLNKANGLSDINIRLLRTNNYNNKILVIYDNCNIDIIESNNVIKNFPDIKLKSLNGKKIINEVTFYGPYAYLACGFGIIVFDTDKLEIKDTYIIGPNASDLQVNQIALKDSLIFAATPNGIYRANKATVLNNYKNWRLDTTMLPKGYYCGVVNVADNIISCYAPSNAGKMVGGKDTVYSLQGNVWAPYPPFKGQGNTFRRMGPVYENIFSLVDPNGLLVREVSTGSIVTNVNHFNGQVDYGTNRDAFFAKDHTGNISYWMADDHFGLFQTYGYYFPGNKVTRNGTNGSNVCNIDIYDGMVAVSPSYINETGTGNFLRLGINFMKERDWSYMPCIDTDGNTVIDVTSVLVDRSNKNIVWVASWFSGVLKYVNGKLEAQYSPKNTNMPEIDVGVPRCTGLTMDKDGNVWFANSDEKNFLNVIKRNGQYINFAFKTPAFVRKTFIDKNNYVYVMHERNGGLTVYKNTNFAAPQIDVNYKLLSNTIGSGNLGSNSVYSVAEDKDGKIWIGTAEGIRVIYNPTAIFSGGDFDAQPIKIVQDGNVELLLGREAVNAIAVDGANNKWCATQLGGVYCFSPDGLTQLYHFTKENSPLYSNTILDVNYDAATGDVFFATDAGLQSFRGIIVEGEKEYNNVYAYPNPVKPGYQGTVLVRGLVDNSIVKITDESGNMVWETKSTGGQIEWPLKTFVGNKVTSGVYIVYAATTDGSLRAVTKVLVVN